MLHIVDMMEICCLMHRYTLCYRKVRWFASLTTVTSRTWHMPTCFPPVIRSPRTAPNRYTLSYFASSHRYVGYDSKTTRFYRYLDMAILHHRSISFRCFRDPLQLLPKNIYYPRTTAHIFSCVAPFSLAVWWRMRKLVILVLLNVHVPCF